MIKNLQNMHEKSLPPTGHGVRPASATVFCLSISVLPVIHRIDEQSPTQAPSQSLQPVRQFQAVLTCSTSRGPGALWPTGRVGPGSVFRSRTGRASR